VVLGEHHYCWRALLDVELACCKRDLRHLQQDAQSI